MPLAIALDALVLGRILVEDIICTIDAIVFFVLYTLYGVYFFHLLLIAWERYVATVKWMKFKTIVTKDRLNKYEKAYMACLSALLTFTLGAIMEAIGVRYELILVLDVLVSIFWVVCFFLKIHFYVKINKGVRNQNRTQIYSVNALVRARFEKNIAYTALLLTLFAGISGVPGIVVFYSGKFRPFSARVPFFDGLIPCFS